MPADIYRDSSFAQVVRYLTKDRFFQYPEHKADFKVPVWYTKDAPFPPTVNEKVPSVQSGEDGEVPSKSALSSELNLGEAREPAEIPPDELGRAHSNILHPHNHSVEDRIHRIESNLSKLERGVSYPVRPQVLEDGTVLVDWYTTDDPDNPQNWSLGKKVYTALLICLYTCSVYMGSSIFASSVPGVIEHFNVSSQEASLGLSMYVLAYGIGPMLWAPMSEIPVFGRNVPYILTFTIFVVLTLAPILGNSFGGLIAARFFLGFFGSPCLANGGATFMDLFHFHYIAVALPSWAFWATVGPSLGPVIGGFAVTAMGWRWSGWVILWFTGPVLIAMWFSLPETSAANILLRRAQRLRKVTGNDKLKSQSEVDQAKMSPKDIALEAVWKPIELIVLDPSIAFTAAYIALVYGIFYSFFEAFPLVYGGIYGFTLSQVGLTFLSTAVGVILALIVYLNYTWFKVVPYMKEHGFLVPEKWLLPALVASWCAPIGLFFFGWTARESIHFIVSLIGVVILVSGVFILFQCVFMYLAMSYPKYTASLFAGNDFARSIFAATAVHFATPMFKNLGVGGAASLLGGLTLVCVGGIYVLYYYGEQLRARSRFTK